MKKLYLVSREVYATNVQHALTAKGKIYSVQLAEEKSQPEAKTKNLGFKTKKN